MNKTDDQLYAETIEVARETKSVTVSILQRRMRIGYPRAARYLKEMVKSGILTKVEETNRYIYTELNTELNTTEKTSDIVKEFMQDDTGVIRHWHWDTILHSMAVEIKTLRKVEEGLKTKWIDENEALTKEIEQLKTEMLAWEMLHLADRKEIARLEKMAAAYVAGFKPGKEFGQEGHSHNTTQEAEA